MRTVDGVLIYFSLSLLFVETNTVKSFKFAGPDFAHLLSQTFFALS